MNVDDIKSNRILVCCRCGDKIVLDNYSGWEAFVDNGKITQAICLFCNSIPDNGEKNDD